MQVSPLSVPATDRSRAVHAVEIADADADTDAGRRRGREVLVLAGAMRVGAAWAFADVLERVAAPPMEAAEPEAAAEAAPSAEAAMAT